MGPLHVQRVDGPVEIVDVLVGQRNGVDALLLGPLDNLVIHVGEVLDVLDRITQVLQVPAQNIESDVAQGVADVGSGIGGDAADVHLGGFPVRGRELMGLSGQGVVKPHCLVASDATAQAAMPSSLPIKPM